MTVCWPRSQPVHVTLLQQTLQNGIQLVPGLGHLQLWGRRCQAGVNSQTQGRWAANWAGERYAQTLLEPGPGVLKVQGSETTEVMSKSLGSRAVPHAHV